MCVRACVCLFCYYVTRLLKRGIYLSTKVCVCLFFFSKGNKDIDITDMTFIQTLGFMSTKKNTIIFDVSDSVYNCEDVACNLL